MLTSNWSADHVEHYRISEDAALLDGIEQELREHLTPPQLTLLNSYEATLPARYLLQPVVSRLELHGRPLSDAQWAEVLPATQRFFDDRVRSRSPQGASADKFKGCVDAHASADQRDAGIEKILVGSLDEAQLKTARAYYQNLTERRAKSLAAFKELFARNEGTVCTYPAY